MRRVSRCLPDNCDSPALIRVTGDWWHNQGGHARKLLFLLHLSENIITVQYWSETKQNKKNFLDFV